MKNVRHHIASLDAFRGMTIAAMILVNNPGNWDAVYGQLEHSGWNGCSFADLVFPFFLFIMGVALPFAFARRRVGGATSTQIWLRISRRAAALIALGLALNAVAAAPHVTAMRIPGVLQRIGLVYFVASIIVLHAPVAWQAVVATALLIGHWALLALVPFGAHQAGGMTKAANLAGYIDLRVFGRHMLTTLNDPEGLLGTLSATATTLVGALAGDYLRAHNRPGARVRGLLTGGVLLIGVGIVWSMVLPLNKTLWTGSYAVVASGTAAVTFAILYWLVDVRDGGGRLRPFLWLGANPLAIYFLAEFAGLLIERPWLAIGGERWALKDVVFWHVVAPFSDLSGGPFASLAFAVAFALVWITLARLLYVHGVRVQV